MKTPFRALIVLIIAVSITACADLIDGPFHGRDHDDDDSTEIDTTDYTGGGDTTKIDSTVCFSRDVLPILISNCAMSGCHNESSHEDGVVLTTYAYVIRNVTPGSLSRSELYEVITETDPDKVMPPPPGKLTTEQINTIARWIKEGATNRDCSNETACDTSNVTYTATIAPLLTTWCVGCHGARSTGPFRCIGRHRHAHGRLCQDATIRTETGRLLDPEGQGMGGRWLEIVRIRS